MLSKFPRLEVVNRTGTVFAFLFLQKRQGGRKEGREREGRIGMDGKSGEAVKAGGGSKRVGMNYAAFSACKWGQQLREKEMRERKAKRANKDATRGLKTASSFNRIRTTYTKQRPLFMEMLKTEKAYLSSLHVVVSRFLLPLQVAQESYPIGILTKQEISCIFGNIAQIFEVNMELLQIIEDNLGISEDPTKQAEKTDDDDLAAAFAEAFSKMLPVFKAFYSVYANAYENGIQKLEECRVNNPLFKRLLETCQRHEDCRGLDLGDLLIKPVQRVCKYPLFFRELLSLTEESHPMYSKLVAASNAVAGVAQRVNQTGRDTENALQTFRIAARIEGIERYDPTLQVVAPGRQFLQEFQCKVHYSFQEPGAKPSKEMLHAPFKKKPRNCFLFTDVLLITKAMGNDKLDFRFWLELENILVTIPPSQATAADDSGAPGNGEGFSNAQKRLPLDIVRIRVLKSPQNSPANSPPQSGKSSHRRGRSGFTTGGSANNTALVGAMPVVEKYTLWFPTVQERQDVYKKIQSLQEAIENRAKMRDTALNQQKKDKEAGAAASAVPLAAGDIQRSQETCLPPSGETPLAA